ncbi:MAG: hypothetical protein EB075_11305 [Bacteroidetes bacterium]|nr:hypothetical protein [Bacteroidota bacterium]
MLVEDLVEYYELHESHKYWRRVLSNEWESPFIVWDGGGVDVQLVYPRRYGKIRTYKEREKRKREFMSVSHYLLYKKYPNAVQVVGDMEYSVFEMDSGSFASYTLQGAHTWLSDNMGRVGGRNDTRERDMAEWEEEANWYKFVDKRNLELKKVLLLTKTAELWRFIPGGTTYRCVHLERVRSRLQESFIIHT